MKRKIKILICLLMSISMLFTTLGTNYITAMATEKDSTYYQQLDPNSDEYRQWKEELSSKDNKKRSRSSSNNNSIISKDYIEFKTFSTGRFSIGTVGGNPDLDTDNNQKMLYGHPSSSTSYTTVRIDGKSYTFSADKVSYDAEKSESVAVSECDGIQIKQTLSIIENNNTKRDDVVKINYELKNISDSSKSVGLRIMLDTMLGKNDAAPFRINGQNVTSETEFEGGDIPNSWLAFDSISEPGVVSQGTFYQEDKENKERKPDKVQFANWARLNSTPWDYTIKPDLLNGDSGVATTWNQRSLNVGSSFSYNTYYGLSEMDYDLAPPIALGVYIDNNTLQYQGGYNQINATAYIQNIGDGNATDVKLWIEADDNFEVIASNSTKEISLMKPGESDNHSWQLRINKNGGVAEDTTGIIKIRLQYTEESTGKVGNKEIVKSILIYKNSVEKQAIIVVPGILGSRLQNDNNKVVWPGVRTVTGELKCDKNGNSSNKITAVSSSAEYGSLDTYEALITDLKKNYGKNYDIVFAPYDWRLGLDKNAAEIKQHIDKYDKVAVVAHSMGGLVLEKYIHDYGTSKIIKAVPVGTPFWGSIMGARAEFDGYVEALHGFGGTLVDGLVHNFEGLHNLLPNSYYTNAHKWCTLTTNQYKSFWDSITHANLKKELLDWNGTEAFYKKYCNEYLFNQSSYKLNSLHASNSCELDKVNTTYIVGNGYITDSDAEFFDGIISTGVGSAMLTKISYGSSNYYGDGTVSMISATMNRIKASSLNSDTVQYFGNFVILKAISHTGLVKEDDAIDEIKKALNESLVPNTGPVITNSSNRLRSEKVQVADSADSNQGYEDSSKVVQLILTGDISIDMYSQDELKYYYHPNSEDSIKEGPDFVIRNMGKFGDQNVICASFNKSNYTIKLTSNQNQISQIGILNEQNLQSLSDFSLADGDVIEIKYSPEKTNVSHNGKKIRFDGDDSLSSEDVSIISLDTNMEEKGNTIAGRIKLKNCSDISIPLKEITLGYIFNSDGHDNNIAEFDWVCNNNVNITNTAKGDFQCLSNGDMQFNVSLDNDQLLEAGNELEVHFRIHTTDWKNYDLTNDYSRNSSQYSTNQSILMYYKDVLVWGDENIKENN